MLILTTGNFKSSKGAVVWLPTTLSQEDNDFL